MDKMWEIKFLGCATLNMMIEKQCIIKRSENCTIYQEIIAGPTIALCTELIYLEMTWICELKQRQRQQKHRWAGMWQFAGGHYFDESTASRQNIHYLLYEEGPSDICHGVQSRITHFRRNRREHATGNAKCDWWQWLLAWWHAMKSTFKQDVRHKMDVWMYSSLRVITLAVTVTSRTWHCL